MKDLEELYSGTVSDLKLYFLIRNRCEDICKYIIDCDMTIRQVAEKMTISKTTVHKYIHTYIRTYFDDKYIQIKNRLKFNKQYRFKRRKFWQR